MATQNPSGIVYLRILDSANKDHQIKHTPIYHNGIVFISGGLTVGCTEPQVKALIRGTEAYYKITYDFYPGTGEGKTSDCYHVDVLKDILKSVSTKEWLAFTKLDQRPEVQEFRTSLGNT